MKHDDGESRHTESREQTGRRHRPSRRLTRWATGLSVLAAIVLVGGFLYGAYAALGGSIANGSTAAPANQPTGDNQPPAAAGKRLHLVALGDSLTHGLGDASGQGYVGDVSRQYRQQGYTVIQSNLGIDGLTSGRLLGELKEPSMQSLLRSADVVLISIGGNDLNNAAGLPRLDSNRIATAEKAFNANLKNILSAIHALNQKTTIALIGLYNPYGDAGTARETDDIIESWNLHEQQVAATIPQTIVVQTFDLFHLHPSQLLYVDHFHPNQTGYQRIADRVWQDLQS